MEKDAINVFLYLGVNMATAIQVLNVYVMKDGMGSSVQNQFVNWTVT